MTDRHATDPRDDVRAERRDRSGETDESTDLPAEVVEEAERLTRLAREATDDAERRAYRDERAALLEDHEYTARLRRDSNADVLVLYPDEWVEDDTVRRERIDDLDRAVERQLSGTGDPDEWAEIDDHNRALARQVREEHGDVHGANAEAFAEFVSNHYAKPVEDVTGGELREFLEEYFPRNAWPTDEQQAVVGRSVELVYELADAPVPDV